MIRKVMVVMAALFLMSPAIAFAADFCAADTNGDCKVDLTDLVTMKSEFMKTDCEACSPPYPAPVPKTAGDTWGCYRMNGSPLDCAGTGQDSEYQKGVAWPNPRFADHGNGTVTDNLTGLMWTRDVQQIPGQMNWQDALDACLLLVYTGYDDWRMPNVRELQSLIDYGEAYPSLPLGHPFYQPAVSFNCWSSTTHASLGSKTYTWVVYFGYGGVSTEVKTLNCYVWPVRGGQ